MNITELLCLIFLMLTIFPYVGYPMLVVAFSRLFADSWCKGSDLPRVCLVISAYNEEAVIQEKIENALNLDYPVDRLEIVVVSDGSTDATEQIVAACSDRRVVLKAFERAGKTACLNRVIPDLDGEIVLLTDANAIFPPDLLKNLVRHFVDRRIGLVSGWTKYLNAAGREESTGVYSRLERLLKEAESRIDSCVGADGAVFALRRELFRPLMDGDINDFVIPLNVIGQGRRVILDPEVYCLERPADDGAGEFRRQVRITNRTLGAMMRHRHFLNPVRYGWFSIFLWSHKLMRFLVPFFFAGTFVLALGVARTSVPGLLLVLSQALFVMFGLAALRPGFGGRAGNLCAYFLLTITAQLVGWAKWVTGKADVMWTPQR